MRVAIHQPNYFPWMGFWRKVAQADVCILLDTVQYSKGSYTNRVQCLSPAGPRWLTIPVHVPVGTTMTDVWPAQQTWSDTHLNILREWYRDAPLFQDFFPLVQQWIRTAPQADLATINEGLIRTVADWLGLTTRFVCASELGVGSTDRTGRLVDLCQRVGGASGTYLTGRGGLAYLEQAQFEQVSWRVQAVLHDGCDAYSVLHYGFHCYPQTAEGGLSRLGPSGRIDNPEHERMLEGKRGDT